MFGGKVVYKRSDNLYFVQRKARTSRVDGQCEIALPHCGKEVITTQRKEGGSDV